MLSGEESNLASSPGQDARNILIVRLSSIGDVIFALPALEVLRSHRPDARISWVVEDRAADILANHPLLDEVIVMPRRKWRRMRSEGARRLEVLRAMRAFGRDLRRRDFDLSIDFQANIKSGLVSFAARAPVRLGFGRDECREPNWLFTNHRLPLGGRVMHRIERDLRLLTLMGLPYEFRWPRLRYSEADRRPVEDFLAGNSGDQRPLIVLNPGTSTWFKSKRWWPEYYATLADRLVEERNARIVVSWGPGEEELVEAILSKMEQEARAAPDLVNMRQVGCLMSRADLVVGSDTGPVHLAAIQGRKTVALFGPYDPRFYYPYQHPERAGYAALPCSPCRFKDCHTLDCMRLIAPGAVLELCRDALDGIPRAAEGLSPMKTVRL